MAMTFNEIQQRHEQIQDRIAKNRKSWGPNDEGVIKEEQLLRIEDAILTVAGFLSDISEAIDRHGRTR